MKEPLERLPSSAPFSSASPAMSASPGALAGAGAPGPQKAAMRSFPPGSPSDDPLDASPGLKGLAFPTNEALYTHALDAAIELLRGDGGVLATLDPTGQRLVVRCQRDSGLLAAQYSALAALGRQPRPSGGLGNVLEEGTALELEPTRPLPMLPGALGAASTASHQPPAAPSGESDFNGLPHPSFPTGGIGGEPPTGYAKGYGLLGALWQMNQAMALSREKCRQLLRDETTPADQDAPWHIGAPIRVPQPLISLGTDDPAPVVGVLSIFIQDSHWSATKRHLELLQLHADRVALALQTAWLEETRANQGKLLHQLHNAVLRFSATLNREQFYAELHTLAATSLDSITFAVLLTHPATQEMEYSYIAENGSAPRSLRLLEAQMPGWWQMVKAGTLVNISTAEQRREYPNLLHPGWPSERATESLMVVPLSAQTREQSLGALVVASESPQVYRREQVETLGTIARIAAFGLETAELSQQRSAESQGLAVARKQQIAALNNAVITINSSLHLEKTLAALVGQFRLLTQAQICTVFLLDEDEKTLVARASNSDYRALGLPRLEDIRLPLSKTFMKRLKAGEQIMLDDLETERRSQTPAGELYRRFDIQTALLLPISRQERLLGMLVVYTPGQRHRFPPEEISLLEGLASQAAVAIHNARLYTDLQQALERQKELDRLKDDFIVTISHEFRTPLTAIEGYASLLQRHSAKITADQAQRFSTEITRATHQLVGMVQTVLDAPRIDADKFTLTLQPVEVRPLAERALALIQPDVQQTLHMEIAPQLWVSADPERLRQVMTNLLSNAAKYSPASSAIDFVARIEPQFVPPEAALPDKYAPQAPQPTLGHLIVSVIDRGEGIAPDDQKRLFQKFFRLPKSLTTPVRGTGLGLYICRQYLTAMGGFIWVESTPGQGATFSFALPILPPPPEPSGLGSKIGPVAHG